MTIDKYLAKREYVEARVKHLLKTRTAQEMREAAQAVENLESDIEAAMNTYTGTLSPEQCVEVCNKVAWDNKANGWGVSEKRSGNRASRYDGKECALDILHHKPTNIVVDCIASSGSDHASATWIVHGANTQANRPWLAPIIPQDDSGTVDPDVDPDIPPVEPIHLDRQEFYDEMIELHRFYKAPEGLQRKTGLASEDGTPDFTGIAAWIFDIYLNNRLHGMSAAQAREEYRKEIRKTTEWIGHHAS